MSANTNYGYEDTLTGTMALSLPALDYDTDYAVTQDNANEVKLTNVTTGMNQPEILRFAIQDVGNVYGGTSIDPMYYAPIKKGKKLLCSDQLSLGVTMNGMSYYVPIKLGLTIEYPTGVAISDSAITDALHRVFALAYDVSKDTPSSGVYTETLTRIKRLLRSSLDPTQ